jgi:hypothetical protein
LEQCRGRTIASLTHPHICTLYDVGTHEGLDFLVMELLEGETLAARLARGPLSVENTLEYAIQIASALDGAHRVRIVHRDLKPVGEAPTRDGRVATCRRVRLVKVSLREKVRIPDDFDTNHAGPRLHIRLSSGLS